MKDKKEEMSEKNKQERKEGMRQVTKKKERILKNWTQKSHHRQMDRSNHFRNSEAFMVLICA